jgi:hypothetical protein
MAGRPWTMFEAASKTIRVEDNIFGEYKSIER